MACCCWVSVPMNLSFSCCIAELSLPPGVVLDCVIFEAICFAVSSEVDIPSTCAKSDSCTCQHSQAGRNLWVGQPCVKLVSKHHKREKGCLLVQPMMSVCTAFRAMLCHADREIFGDDFAITRNMSTATHLAFPIAFCCCIAVRTLTVRRVSCTHCRLLLISWVVSPNLFMFFSATSTAFSISSTYKYTRRD